MPNADPSFFAETNFHQLAKRVGIKQPDRLSHFYVIGKTGVGKSTLLETLARQDLAAGRGFALIDPHGDLVERIWCVTVGELWFSPRIFREHDDDPDSLGEDAMAFRDEAHRRVASINCTSATTFPRKISVAAIARSPSAAASWKRSCRAFKPSAISSVLERSLGKKLWEKQET